MEAIEAKIQEAAAILLDTGAFGRLGFTARLMLKQQIHNYVTSNPIQSEQMVAQIRAVLGREE